MRSDNPQHLLVGVEMMKYVHNQLLKNLKSAYKSEKIFDLSDSYANLLYKTGNKTKAIEILKDALQRGRKSDKIGKNYIDYYEELLRKMEADLPTWNVNKK
ncbi:hypothetical protein D9M68_773330 [compost metagenome]